MGELVGRLPQKHECSPGVTYEERLFRGVMVTCANPPSPSMGDIWLCDCGQYWIADHVRPGRVYPKYRKATWWERRKLIRAKLREERDAS